MTNRRKREICDKLSISRQSLMTLFQSLEAHHWQLGVFAEDSTWSVIDILRHLVDAESGMTSLMKGIRAGGEGVPEDVNLARWNARIVRKGKEKSAAQLLEELETSRVVLFSFIDSLEKGDWSKLGRHGSLRIMSIDETCHLIADHEIAHSKDIRGALADNGFGEFP